MNFYYISLNLHKFDTLIKFYLKVNNSDDFYLSFVFMCAFYRFLAVVSMYMYCIYIDKSDHFLCTVKVCFSIILKFRGQFNFANCA